MKFKVGDKVMVEAEITDTSHGEPKYYVKTEWGTNKWAYEREIHPMPDKDAKTYEDGMNDAWETAKKIAVPVDAGGFSADELGEVFDLCTWEDILCYYTAAEAAEKIAAWEESRKIHVGDVVEVGEKETESFAGIGVVTGVDVNKYFLLFSDGEAGTCERKHLTKTGRHIDVGGLLAEIGGANGL